MVIDGKTLKTLMRRKINEHQYIALKVELNSEVTKKASNILSIISMDYGTWET